VALTGKRRFLSPKQQQSSNKQIPTSKRPDIIIFHWLLSGHCNLIIAYYLYGGYRISYGNLEQKNPLEGKVHERR
jgi:hypothetical protein